MSSRPRDPASAAPLLVTRPGERPAASSDSWLDQLTAHLGPFVAEMLATAFLIIFTLAAVSASAMLVDKSLTVGRIVYSSIAYATAFAALVYAFSFDSRHSGVRSSEDGAHNIRHLNPAVTLGLLFAGRIGLLKAVVHIFAQALGAVVAAAVLPNVLPAAKVNAFDAMHNVSVWQSVVVSIVCSATVVLVVLLTTWGPAPIEQPVLHDLSEQHPHTVHEMNAVLLGGVVFVCVAAGCAVSGGWLHPFMAAVSSFHAAQWPLSPLLSPLAGALLAGLPMRFIFPRMLPPFPARRKYLDY